MTAVGHSLVVCDNVHVDTLAFLTLGQAALDAIVCGFSEDDNANGKRAAATTDAMYSNSRMLIALCLP
jgi:hypothetical protein